MPWWKSEDKYGVAGCWKSGERIRSARKVMFWKSATMCGMERSSLVAVKCFDVKVLCTVIVMLGRFVYCWGLIIVIMKQNIIR